MISKFEERIWNQLRNSFTKKMQTVPVMKDVITGGNKSMCKFLDFGEFEHSTEESEDSELKNSHINEEIIKTLLGVLTVREEEVLDYVLGFTDIGKQSQSEAATIMGTTRENVAMIQKKAVDKITEFCREQNINASSSLETIKFKIRTYQKQKFKDPARYKVFEIGCLITRLVG